jgi:hypothetical protein
MLFEPEEEITGTTELLYRVDALRFARERLGFSPDAKQAAVMSGKIPPRAVELHTAMGEIDNHGGDGGASRVDRPGEPDDSGESERAAERGVLAEGKRVRAQARDTDAGRWGQRDLAAVSERSASSGIAGVGEHGAGLFGGVR